MSWVDYFSLLNINMKDCCRHNDKDKACFRKSDKKVFSLPRKFSRKKCENPNGFTMKASCAPYKDCFRKRNKQRRKQKGGGSLTVYFAGGCFWQMEKIFSDASVALLKR